MIPQEEEASKEEEAAETTEAEAVTRVKGIVSGLCMKTATEGFFYLLAFSFSLRIED